MCWSPSIWKCVKYGLETHLFFGNQCYNCLLNTPGIIVYSYYSILSWANIPLDYKRHCEKKGLLYDLFKPNIPRLWSGLISNKCFINKRVLLEKSRKKRSAPSAQFLPPVWLLSTRHCGNPRRATTSLTSRKPHMNDSGLYWMLMTVFDTLRQRLDASATQK